MSAAKSCRPRAAASETGVAPSEVGVYAATVTGGPLGSMHTYVLYCPGQGVAVFGRAGFIPSAEVLRWFATVPPHGHTYGITLDAGSSLAKTVSCLGKR